MEITVFHLLYHILIKFGIKRHLVYIETNFEFDPMTLKLMVYGLHKFLDIILSVLKHVHTSVRSEIVPGPKRVGGYWVHVSFVTLCLFGIILNWINLVIIKNGFCDVIYVDDVNVEGDVQKFRELFFDLGLQEKLTVIFLVVVDRMLKLVPGITFECIEHIVVCCHEIIVVVKLVWLLCRKAK